MIESLKYVVRFNTTGRTLKNQLNFKPGITVIKGENEAGKSFVLEMIRFALFGSEALRGLKTDYDKLDVTLKIQIKGKSYTIHRLLNKAWINGSEVVGTTAVNKAIIKALGFKLDVFDLACNAKQGQLDRLTEDMKPAERRKIIDDVTGLSQFERVERECRDEANVFRRMYEAIEAQLVEPEAPVKPNDYEPSAVLQERLDKEIRNETLRSMLQHMGEPVKPTEPEGSRDAIQHESDRAIHDAQRASIESRLAKLPITNHSYSEQELAQFEKYYQQVLRGPLPHGYPRASLETWRRDWIIRANASEPLKCPECGTIVQGEKLPEEPPISMDEIETEIRQQAAWEGHQYEDIPQPPLTMLEIEEVKLAPERKLLMQQLADLGSPMVDRSVEAEAWLDYDWAMNTYAREQQEYANYLQKKTMIEALPEPEPLLREKLDMSQRYETLLSRYEALYESYEGQKKQIEAAAAKREGYKRGADALKDVRQEVKRYLIPSLSKVSSNLLAEMTDGQRRSIKIDEDFEIYVDNQHVRTLSGSGVSVVNLALRIALGQVLTQSVVPFFLADEIDANMAERRTKATHDSLKRLKSKLKQIIVVTHKEFEGDQTICLS